MKTILAIILLSLFLASCASPQPFGPAGPDPQDPRGPWPPASETIKEISIEMSQFSFSPSTITVKKGEKVKITVASKDVTHSLLIPEFNVNSGPVAKDQSGAVEFTADKAGAFEFRCATVCGVDHKDMKGTLIVEE